MWNGILKRVANNLNFQRVSDIYRQGLYASYTLDLVAKVIKHCQIRNLGRGPSTQT